MDMRISDEHRTARDADNADYHCGHLMPITAELAMVLGSFRDAVAVSCLGNGGIDTVSNELLRLTFLSTDLACQTTSIQ